jgi:cobalt/nickel transport system permease protein
VNTGTSVVTWAASAGGLGYAVRRVNHELGKRQVPLMGVTAAFIFAAQMMNFTGAGGTSGHLLGGALAAILLGPWAGMLVLTSVLAVQALLFQDGGLLALGANDPGPGRTISRVGSQGAAQPHPTAEETATDHADGQPRHAAGMGPMHQNGDPGWWPIGG